MTTAATWQNQPPAPLDIWASLRTQAPDTDDHQARHQRGFIRLPWRLGDDLPAGLVVPAWVCCDPACGGVEFSEYVLQLNHNCCTAGRGRHMTGLGSRRFTGHHHGPFTPHWQPNQA